MKKIRITILTTVVAVGAALGIQAAASAHGGDLEGSDSPSRLPAVSRYVAPRAPADLGVGESLIVVSAGTFETRGEAETTNAAFAFGEMQGFYAVPVSQFQGLQAQLGSAKPWVLASVFRTQAGAEEFAALASLAGATPLITGERSTSLGGEYAGLGQESDPSGLGPLTRSTSASRPVNP
jgi:hypothetical protein